MDDLIPVDEAARQLGIPVSRLIGFLARNGIADPIGGYTPAGFMVYGWSCRELAKRLESAAVMTSERHSDTSTAIQASE